MSADFSVLSATPLTVFLTWKDPVQKFLYEEFNNNGQHSISTLSITAAILPYFLFLLQSLYFAALSPNWSFLFLMAYLITLGLIALPASILYNYWKYRAIFANIRAENISLFSATISCCLILLGRVSGGQCDSLLYKDEWNCNPTANVFFLPQDTLMVCLLLPFTLCFNYRSRKWEIICSCWLVVILCVIFAIALGGAIKSIPMVLFYVACSVMVLYEGERQNISKFLIAMQLHNSLVAVAEHEEKAVELTKMEMRHLVGNVAHDLKTPLTGIFGSLESMSHALRKLKLKKDKDSAKESVVDQLVVESSATSINSNIKHAKSICNFMLMSINRCIDYTKVSKGLGLVPYYETMKLRDGLQLPISCVNELQSKIAIVVKIEQALCSHVITDKQWYQENLLTLLSNATKYTSKGEIIVSVSLCNEEDLPSDISEQCQQAITKHSGTNETIKYVFFNENYDPGGENDTTLQFPIRSKSSNSPTVSYKDMSTSRFLPMDDINRSDTSSPQCSLSRATSFNRSKISFAKSNDFAREDEPLLLRTAISQVANISSRNANICEEQHSDVNFDKSNSQHAHSESRKNPRSSNIGDLSTMAVNADGRHVPRQNTTLSMLGSLISSAHTETDSRVRLASLGSDYESILKDSSSEYAASSITASPTRRLTTGDESRRRDIECGLSPSESTSSSGAYRAARTTAIQIVASNNSVVDPVDTDHTLLRQLLHVKKKGDGTPEGHRNYSKFKRLVQDGTLFPVRSDSEQHQSLNEASSLANSESKIIHGNTKDNMRRQTVSFAGNVTISSKVGSESTISRFSSVNDLKCTKGREYILTVVEDMGIGIALEAMKHLFSPFKQIQRLAGGTGLGLFSLANRVQALDGFYGVHNRTDGQQGSVFWFAVPYRPDNTAIYDAHATNNSGEATNADRIMLSDKYPNEQKRNVIETFFMSSCSSDQALQAEIFCASTAQVGDIRSSADEDDNMKFKGQHLPFESSAVLPPHQVSHQTTDHSQIAYDDRARSPKADLHGYIRRTEHRLEQASTIPQYDNASEEEIEDMSRMIIHNFGSQDTTGSDRESNADVPHPILKLLVVDDSPIIRKMCGMMLTSCGHTVSFVENGAEAVESICFVSNKCDNDTDNRIDAQCKDSRYDAVLMDLQMPIMDGLEATKRIRSHESQLRSFTGSTGASSSSKKHQVIIAATANSDSDTISAAYEAGVDGFLGKPFTVDNFHEVYNQIMLQRKPFYRNLMISNKTVIL